MTPQAKPEPPPVAAPRATAHPRSRARAGDLGRSGVPRWLLAIVVALPLALFSIDLGTPSLWDPDEGLAAEVAREMLLTRQWLTPQLNFAPYTEKPPLYFWALAAAMRAFGVRNEAAIRLPSVLLSIAGVWLTLSWGWRHLRPVAGTFAALVLATSAGYVAIGRLGIDDAAAGVLLSIAMLGMSEPLLSRRAGFPWLFYLALGGAILSFGVAAVLLPAAVALLFGALLREPGRWLDLRPFRGLGVLCALVAPVLGLAAARDPGYVRALVFEHNLIRFLDPAFDDSHSYSIVAFAGIVPLLMLPWGVFLPWSLRDAGRSGGERSREARLYLIAWLAGDLLFFVASAANVVAYVVIALTPLALLTGRAIARFLRRPRAASVFGDPLLLGSGLLFVVVLAIPFLTRRLLQNEYPTYADKLVFSFLLIPLAGVGIGAVARRNRIGALGVVALCGALTLSGSYHFGSATVSAYNSMEAPADMIAERLPANASIVSYGTTSHTLAFYSGRPVRLLASAADAGPLLNDSAPVALLTKERFLADVRAELRQPLYLWWMGDSKKVLLANLPPPPKGDRRILLPGQPGGS
ncbi:MAG: glycosyltransferase family 39 protein [Deltaproteobacteria bacterium]|nr:glycosyltransferase family 39 protein [Deltaproteobacteria bacterium]